MQFFDISLNLITLFALVLAIGVVVDDAIVVKPSMLRWKKNMSPLKATKKAMKFAGAIIAITFLMAAVFLFQLPLCLVQ
jgi:HAE1 family hydrophobic/amphiphilic exporter-1